jgi:hypothetical protein
MASTDARGIPQKNVAYRVTFPIYDADGDLVTGAASLDSEISKDGGTFTDCTNEATEIASSSGIYYLDLSNTEMNADTVAIIVKTSTSGAKTTVLIMYPDEVGDIRCNAAQLGGTTQTGRDVGASVLLAADQAVNVTKFNGTAVTARDIGASVLLAADQAVNVTKFNGTSVTARDIGASVLLAADQAVNVTKVDGSALSAHTSGYFPGDLRYIAGSIVATGSAQLGVNVVTQANIDFGALQKSSLNAATPASVTGAVGSVTGAVGSVTGAVGSVTGAVGSVTGNVGGNVVGSVASVSGAVGSVTSGVTVTTNNDKTGYGLSAAAIQAVWDALTSALTAAGSIGKKLADWVIGTTQSGDSYARLGAPVGASHSADVAAVKTVVDLIEDINRNKLEITDANGNAVLYQDDNSTPLFSVAACITDNSTTTTRKRLA